MIVLVHTAHPQAASHAGPNFGRLLSPRQFSRARDTADAGIPWACDNDAYSGFDRRLFSAMLWRVSDLPGCLFVTSPDVVGDWRATRDQFDWWEMWLRLTGQPIAYVLQDGQPAAAVPWERIHALFVGGTTEYKLSAEAEVLVREGKRRGLWVHMGRVNSRRRLHYARAIGCDSVDGGQFSRWRNQKLPLGLEWARSALQERLPLGS